jgi:hypothetical protein
MKTYIRITVLALSMTIFFQITGCGQAATPSEAQARTAYEETIKKMKNPENIELTSFKKTNGYAIEGLGVKGYAIKYEAVLTYKNGLNTDCAELLKMPNSSFSKDDPKKFRKEYFCSMKPKVIEPGQSESVKGEIGFMLTENGWATGK